MRSAAMLVLMLAAGCSTAPVAGLLDWVCPGGFHSDPRRGVDGERLPVIPVDPLVGPGPGPSSPVIPGPAPGPSPDPGTRTSPPVLDPPAPDPIPSGTSRTNLSLPSALPGMSPPNP